LVVIAAVFAGLTWIGLLYQGPHSTEEAVALASATSPASKKIGSVELRAWAARALIRSGDTFEFWILVNNASASPITDLRFIDLDAPGFVPIGNCWIGGVPGCRPGAPSSGQAAGLETPLPAGAIGMAFAELKSSAKPDQEPAPITATVAWKLKGKTETLSVPIQPVTVAPHAFHWVIVVYSLLKDLGLPLLLGVLAYLFQQILQERSRAESAHSTILPTATTNAIRYLLPAAAAIRNLRRVLVEAEVNPADRRQNQAKHQQAFFYFVFLLKRMRDMNSIGGGFFLADVSSEALVAECWRAIHRRAIDHFGYLDLSYTQDLMDAHETISLFLDQFGGRLNQAQIAALRVAEKFPEWSRDTERNADLKLLRVLAEILQVEANRLYLGWYEQVDSPDEKTLVHWKQAMEAFRETHSKTDGDRLLGKLDGYIKNLPWRVRRRFRERTSRQPAAS
jgi:hypothetical protein